MTTRRTTRALGALTLAVTVALGAAACGDDDGSADPEPSSTQHNDADVAFASDMLQHHAQALAMVDLTMGRTLDPEVQQLAEDIRAAQGPEIETFTDWLTEWDEDVPATVRDHTNADHGTDDQMDDQMDEMGTDLGTDMPGMMTADEMADLEESSDADFQDRWLQMMVEHHTGAVEMARTAQEEGRYRPALDLAGDIVEGQSAEIDLMNRLLG